jgi:hypothetical protein
MPTNTRPANFFIPFATVFVLASFFEPCQQQTLDSCPKAAEICGWNNVTRINLCGPAVCDFLADTEAAHTCTAKESSDAIESLFSNDIRGKDITIKLPVTAGNMYQIRQVNHCPDLLNDCLECVCVSFCRLHFSELTLLVVGKRVFNLYLSSEEPVPMDLSHLVLSNVDPFSWSGGLKAPSAVVVRIS